MRAQPTDRIPRGARRSAPASIRRAALALVLALLAAACAGPSPRRTHELLLRDVTIVDVATGELLSHRDVAIDRGRISAILPSGPSPRPALRMLDGSGGYLIPGLWDMHVHLADPGYLGLFVASGVVGVRDMGGGLAAPGDGCESLQPSILRQWQHEVATGRRLGPELVLAGQAVSGTGWPTSLTATTAAEAHAAVARLAGEGVHFIKVHDGIPRVAYLALAARARTARLPFAGHLVEEVTAVEAIRAGQRSIEHVRDPLLVCFTDAPARLEQFFLDDGWGESDRAWGRGVHRGCPAMIDALRTHPTWLTPTLVVEKAKVAVEDPSHVHDPRRALLPSSVRAGYAAYVQRMLGQDHRERDSQRLWWRTQQAFVGRMHAAGVKLLAGTDAACEGGLPGTSLHDELAELVAAGLTPLQALRTATLEPARYLGRPKAGRIAEGMEADLVLLDANPLAAIGNTRRIRAVVLDGRLQ